MMMAYIVMIDTLSFQLIKGKMKNKHSNFHAAYLLSMEKKIITIRVLKKNYLVHFLPTYLHTSLTCKLVNRLELKLNKSSLPFFGLISLYI